MLFSCHGGFCCHSDWEGEAERSEGEAAMKNFVRQLGFKVWAGLCYCITG